MAYTPVEQYIKFWLKVKKTSEDGCWNWTGYKNAEGYGAVQWNGKLDRAHRISYRLFHGPIPPGILVCHHCDNPPCVNPKHLFLGTNQDNTDDKVEKHRHTWCTGSEHPNAKLDELKVLEIKRLLRYEITQSVIAKQFGVSCGTIKAIRQKKSWVHVR
jgi:hypothetical protein